ncbi:hypothetical protein AEA09_03980 [Lysinibacillus contaminans]|uniref:DUF418 domain-containing protein n=1 Tax=Lysinibacillus contaminans TaxID=1293441 RepID=A0ABR5JZD0_9BACI|nr:DUF418 domain-containing protein [Lysinibacillus contaminans]KOS67797.1 hypothetical protein AEA09_03980 [Lysinibacillus contaminans]
MKAERVELLDALRGFSLIGILIANMLLFQFGSSGVEIIESASGLNKVSYYFVKIVVEGSFYPIFGFVFGYVLIKMIESREASGLKYKNIVFRRAVGLSVLGAMHLALVWEGDILLTYGSTLFMLLLFFLNRRVKTYFVWGSILIAILGVGSLFGTSFLQLVKPLTASEIMIYQDGTYAEILTQRLSVFMVDGGFLLLLALPIGWLFYVCICFLGVGPFVLFGMGMAKRGAFLQLENSTRTYKKVALLVPGGLLLKGIIIFYTPYSLFIYSLGTYVLAIGYIALFAWLFSRYQTQMNYYFAPIGKLSLTNYLMQSIICTTIFYGYGFGLFGKLGIFVGILLSVIIYAIQLKASQLYLKRFSLGPVETILRWFVYFKNPRKVD